jgi:predicted DNA-binding transcriptional regulator YafY
MIAGDHFSQLDATSLIQSEYFRAARRERNWHSSQQIQELANGNLELSLTLNSLEEIVPWILSCGKDCEVVSPAKLRREVRSRSI